MWTIHKKRRMNIMIGIIIGIIVLLISRLAWMQLVNGVQYKKKAEENRTLQIIVPAQQGNSYDHSGAPLVSNRPRFAISIIFSEYADAYHESSRGYFEARK